MSINLINIAILNIKGADNCCIVNGIGKNEAINLLKNFDFCEKVEHYKIQKIHFHI